ncbi:MAG: cupin domain-containing protein [Candidatus Aminicenantes bacterium]|nr:MAG: cupin domain-containing protein [Candidatus Aminicenantes bacterium]TEU06352.1 MAG: cupin domain-containing protein [Candidatus Aminicenantes bacterium]
MIIKKDDDVSEGVVEEEGIKNVIRKILIGPDDGSSKIVMRHFKILPEGHTPFHSHDHEHVVKIENGRGVVVDENGEDITVSQGQSLLIEQNKNHQFKNPFQEPFEFLCIIINPEKVN